MSYYSRDFYSFCEYEKGFPEYIVEDLKEQRQKLIYAWQNKDNSDSNPKI